MANKVAQEVRFLAAEVLFVGLAVAHLDVVVAVNRSEHVTTGSSPTPNLIPAASPDATFESLAVAPGRLLNCWTPTNPTGSFNVSHFVSVA